MAYDFMGKPETISTARNTLSVDGVLYQRLLAKLDENNSKGGTSAKRIFRRLGYAHAKLCIHIESEGHNSRALVVATRNLSQGGVSVLHSNFMYNGTLLTVDLINTKGEIVPRRGSVTRCEHRGGRVHEVGIKFEEEISLREFLSPDSELLIHARERIDPESMNIKLLVYSEDTEFASMMRQHLLPSSLCYTFAKSQEEAMEKFEEQDMIVCHVDPESMITPSLVRSFREKGFQNPIILVGQPKNPTDIHIISACGGDMILPWPCDEQTMLCSIGEYTLNEWTPESLENIRSCLSPETRQVLTLEMARLGVTLDQQVRTDNQPEVHKSCMRIQMLSPLLGLNSMQSNIKDLTEKTSAEGSVKEHAENLIEVASICKALNSIAA